MQERGIVMPQNDKVLLKVKNLKQYFPVAKKGMYVKANDGILLTFTKVRHLDLLVSQAVVSLLLDVHYFSSIVRQMAGPCIMGHPLMNLHLSM